MIEVRDIEPALLTKEEAAKYLGVCIATMTKIQKDIIHVKIGRRVLFQKSDLNAYIDSCKVNI